MDCFAPEAMKTKFFLLSLVAVLLCGCQTYNYRIVQPSTAAPVVGNQPVSLKYSPLEYQLSRDQSHLILRITNPTDERIILLGERSFVVDPQGESHPLRGRVIGPHSYTRLLLPPIPFSYAHPDPTWAWGWGGYHDPFWGPFYGPGFYGPPPLEHDYVYTIYDWHWKTGPVRLRLTYEQANKTFEQNFEFDRQAQERTH